MASVAPIAREECVAIVVDISLGVVFRRTRVEGFATVTTGDAALPGAETVDQPGHAGEAGGGEDLQRCRGGSTRPGDFLGRRFRFALGYGHPLILADGQPLQSSNAAVLHHRSQGFCWRRRGAARRAAAYDNGGRWGSGVDYIQLREKDLSARELERLTHESRQAISDGGGGATKLLVNGRPTLPWPAAPTACICLGVSFPRQRFARCGAARRAGGRR